MTESNTFEIKSFTTKFQKPVRAEINAKKIKTREENTKMFKERKSWFFEEKYTRYLNY